MDINKVIFDLLPFIADVYYILHLTKIVKCVDLSLGNDLYLQSDSPVFTTKIIKLISNCHSLNSGQLLAHDDCLPICRNSFPLDQFLEPLNSFDNLRRAFYLISTPEVVGLKHGKANQSWLVINVDLDFIIGSKDKTGKHFDDLDEVFQKLFTKIIYRILLCFFTPSIFQK